jgi:hypothetical protein
MPTELVTDSLPELTTAYPLSDEDVTAYRTNGHVRLTQVAAAAEAAGEEVVLPHGAEIRRVTEADILADDDLSDEEKEDILAQIAAIEKLDKPRD